METQAHINTGRCTARLQRRARDAAVVSALSKTGYHPLCASVLAGRCGGDAARLAAPALGALSAPDALPDIGRASERLVRAVREAEIIGIVTDHDGVTSHAVLIEALTRWCGVERSRLRSYTGRGVL